MNDQILTWLLGLIATFSAIQWNRQSEKAKKLNDILNDKKVKIYMQVIDLLFELINGIKYKDANDLAVQEMRQINKELILFASPTVYKIYGDWFSNLYGANKSTPQQSNGVLLQLQTRLLKKSFCFGWFLCV
jgi:hypothetical protein